MITEMLVALTVIYLYDTGYLYKRKFRQVCEKSGLYNKEHQSLRVHRVEQFDFGYKLRIGVPYGISFDQIQKMENTFLTNLGACQIGIERDKAHSMIDMLVYEKSLSDLKYEPIDTIPNELYIGYNHVEHLKVDMNRFPHLLIGGESGSGKSRLILLMLTNLIHNHKNVDIYLIQIRKSDLAVFKNCEQVRYMARTLEEARDMLKEIDDLCIKRENIIDELTADGIYNISDYNKIKRRKMKYVYVVLDEFSFFMTSAGEDKEIKALKNEILSYIKKLVMVGRSLGIFIICSLQKPTASSIPSDIKSLLSTRISFKQLDSQASIVVLGNGDATELEERVAICRTIKQEKFRVPEINHSLIMENIKSSIEENHQYINLNEENNNLEVVKRNVDYS
jgi:energy-coupling factor transporter ATP-binding protein EcfA2